MTTNIHQKALLIGGSSGSLQVLIKIVSALPEAFSIPVIIIVHRQKNVSSELNKILGTYAPSKKIIEPVDKEPVNESCIYLAPQNYHLLIEEDRTFSLDYSEPVHFSRPSIDVTFETAAAVYRQHTVGILLSGANHDGALGLGAILNKGGIALAQDPATADYAAMPKAALENNPLVKSLSPLKIISFVQALNSNQSRK